MKPSFDLEKKIVQLQQEVKSLKASQILGGDNSRVYNHYIVGYSPKLYYRSDVDMWLVKSDYDDPEFIPIPGSAYTVTSALYPLKDDPFALVGIDKIEVWRSGHLLEWSAYQATGYVGYGQKSQYGDSLIVRYTKNPNGWGAIATPTLGTQVRFEMCPEYITDSPASPMQYEYRIWFKTSTIGEYGWFEDYGGA